MQFLLVVGIIPSWFITFTCIITVDLDPNSVQPFDDSYETGLFTVAQVQGMWPVYLILIGFITKDIVYLVVFSKYIGIIQQHNPNTPFSPLDFQREFINLWQKDRNTKFPFVSTWLRLLSKVLKGTIFNLLRSDDWLTNIVAIFYFVFLRMVYQGMQIEISLFL